MLKSTLRICALSFLFIFSFIQIAQACMGVSRTINVRTFNAHLGTGGSGGIGLRNKEVVLTFDDGPIVGRTDRVLNTLRSECVKATFFVVGSMARANPKLLQRIAREGHTIGQHTHNHANLKNTSLASAQRNIESGIHSVRSALGKYKHRSSKLFRYPYLARSAALDVILKRKGLLPLSATVMSQDWKSGSGAGMVQRVMTRLARTGRGVILLHDIQPKTVSALPQLLSRLRQGGYKIVHIRSGGVSAGPALASLSSKSPSKGSSKKKSRQIASITRRTKNKANIKPKRARWSLFGRRTDSAYGIDNTKTASIRRSTSTKKRQRVSVGKTEKKAKRSGLSNWIKKRRAARAERRKKETRVALRSKSKKRTAKRKSNASKPKRKTLLARIAERRAERKAKAKKSRSKKVSKRVNRTTKKAGKKKSAEKKLSLLARMRARRLARQKRREALKK